MKALQDTPTVELLAEWGKSLTAITAIEYRAKRNIACLPDYHSKMRYISSREAIAAELDRRCINAGVVQFGDLPTFTKFGEYDIPEPEKDYLPHLESVTLAITTNELRDLLSWLLAKGGNG